MMGTLPTPGRPIPAPHRAPGPPSSSSPHISTMHSLPWSSAGTQPPLPALHSNACCPQPALPSKSAQAQHADGSAGKSQEGHAGLWCASPVHRTPSSTPPLPQAGASTLPSNETANCFWMSSHGGLGCFPLPFPTEPRFAELGSPAGKLHRAAPKHSSVVWNPCKAPAQSTWKAPSVPR